MLRQLRRKPQDAPKRPPRGPQEAPKRPPRGPKTPPRGSKSAPRDSQDALREHLGAILGPSWGHLGTSWAIFRDPTQGVQYVAVRRLRRSAMAQNLQNQIKNNISTFFLRQRAHIRMAFHWAGNMSPLGRAGAPALRAESGAAFSAAAVSDSGRELFLRP